MMKAAAVFRADAFPLESRTIFGPGFLLYSASHMIRVCTARANNANRIYFVCGDIMSFLLLAIFIFDRATGSVTGDLPAQRQKNTQSILLDLPKQSTNIRYAFIITGLLWALSGKQNAKKEGTRRP
jgi:hypothetical protein